MKKAQELNGKPEVYEPLASCAEAVVGWMRVRGWGRMRRPGSPEEAEVALRQLNSCRPRLACSGMIAA